jgi:hypothetical protein
MIDAAGLDEKQEVLRNPSQGFGACYPPPPRDSQGPKTAASMRLCDNQKAKPSRGEGRKRTGGRAATNAVLAGPEGGQPRGNGAAVVFPLVVGSTHTKQR